MSARGNIVINDRAGTPVAHTYTPDGDDKNGVHLYSEKGSVPAGNPKYSISLRNSAGRYRGSIRLAIPVVQTQTINGVSAPVVVRTAYVEVNTSFDQLSSTQERADAIGLMANSLAAAQTQLNDLLVNLSDIY
jgi:phage tail tape-measure protein